MREVRFDFDTPIDRRGTSSTKWERYAGRDVLPFWIADMEFAAAPCIRDALAERVAHGVFGYTLPPEELVTQVVERLAQRYGWHVERDWLVWIPGVVPGLNLVCRAIGEPGDAVMTATPVYYPFLHAPRNSNRRKQEAPLVRDGDRWTMDVDAMRAAATARTRTFLLCHPQNPTGRAYERAELEALAELALERDWIVCSDEIHCELILDTDTPHIPFATLSEEIARRTITLMAPTKTFNTPGLPCAFAVIPDPRLRRRFRQARGDLVPNISPLAFAAAIAAYRDGEPWRQDLLRYLRSNRDRLEQWVADTPGVTMTHVEATCLGWIDARALGLEAPQAHFEAHGAALSDGSGFGGPGFVRFNFGCPRSMLEEGLARIERALAALG